MSSTKPIKGKPSSKLDDAADTSASSAYQKPKVKEHLDNVSTALDLLSSVSDGADILGPLKAVAGVLSVLVDRAKLVYENRDDLKGLRDRLQNQQVAVEEQLRLLGNTRVANEDSASRGLVKPLLVYTKKLQDITRELDSLKLDTQGTSSKVFKRMWTASTTQRTIMDYTEELDEVFKQFQGEVAKFTAHQTIILNDRVTKLTERSDLSLLRSLPCADARGHQHVLCFEGTRVDAIQQLEKWASSKSKPVMSFVEQAGRGKSTLAFTMADRWEKEKLLGARFFFSRPINIVDGKELATTLARDLVACLPSIRPIVVKAAEEHLNILQYSIDKQLQALVFEPLEELWKKGTAESTQSLTAIQEERQAKVYVNDPNTAPRASWEPAEMTMENKALIKKAWGDWRDAVEMKEWESIGALGIEEAYDKYFDAVEAAHTGNIAKTKSPIIIIDAIDESQKRDQIQILRSFLAFLSTQSSTSLPFKLLLTGRPDEEIIQVLHEYPSIQQHFSLAGDASAGSDIEHYSIYHLRDVGLTLSQIRDFVSRANDLFIWATTAVTFLKSAFNVRAKFASLMSTTTSNTPLDDLYCTVLESVEKSTDPDQVIFLQQLLQAVCVARTPLTVSTMDELLEFGEGVASRIVAKLRSVLSDGSQGEPVQVLHPTFIEFLLRQKPTSTFAVSRHHAESLLAIGCLRAFNRPFHYDICGLSSSSNATPEHKDIPDLNTRIEANITQGLRYASIHGISHVTATPNDQEVVGEWEAFMEQHLFHWLEIVSLLGNTYVLIQLVHAFKIRVEQTLDNEEANSRISLPNVLLWSEDILRMLQLFQGPIERCALQVYYSALPFMSKDSLIASVYRNQFANRIPKVIRGEANREMERIVLTGHTNYVTSLSFSPVGKGLVTGSGDETLHLWDTATGAVMGQPLTGHTNRINCVAFSPNGRRIASGSNDGTVRFWDAEMGKVIGEPSDARMGHITCVVFSPDGSRLASGSYNGTIQLWDPEIGTAVGEPLTGHTSPVKCISYSPDGKKIASCAQSTRHVDSAVDNNTVRLWDAQSGEAIGEFVGHTGPVNCLAFSPDGRSIASGSSDHTLRLWDVETRAAIGEPLTGHSKSVECLAYSPDGKQLVSGSYDGALRLWNAQNGSQIAQLAGHTADITCLAYSPDGKTIASGSWDSTVRLWDADAAVPIGEPFTHHTGIVECLAFSPDGRKIASGSSDNTVHLVETKTIGNVKGPSNEHAARVTFVAFSPDGRQAATGSLDGTVRLWNTETGDAIGGPLEAHIGIYCLAYLPDGRQIVIGLEDGTIQLWDASAGVIVGQLNGHTEWVSCIAISPNGDRIISGSNDRTVRIWDATNHKQIGEPFEEHRDLITGVAISLDGNLIASTSSYETRLWDASNRTALAVIRVEFDSPTCRFQYLDSRPLLIINEHGQPQAVYDVSNPQNPLSIDLANDPSILYNDHRIHFKEPWSTVRGRDAPFRYSLPSDWRYDVDRRVAIHVGKIIYCGRDGSVTILDCSHLV